MEVLSISKARIGYNLDLTMAEIERVYPERKDILQRLSHAAFSIRMSSFISKDYLDKTLFHGLSELCKYDFVMCETTDFNPSILEGILTIGMDMLEGKASIYSLE